MDENGSLALTPEQAAKMRLELALKRYIFLLMIIPRIYCSVQFIFMNVDVTGAKNLKNMEMNYIN